MINNNIFKRIFEGKSNFTFSKKLMRKIVENNRVSLGKINTWNDENSFQNSYYNYGVPENIMPLLGLDIGEEVTYSDLILYYSRHLKRVNYLELGVSVGKNFFQMCEGFKNASLTGFDIENIYPALKDKFIFKCNESWTGKPDSKRTELFSLSKFTYKTNSISYIAADIWDENSWSKLKGNKYNVIFSDALHDPEALMWEYHMLDKYQLLNNEFIMMWDDLNNGLENSFYKIAANLKLQYNISDKNIRIIKIAGWLGKNYPIKHDIGIITNLSLH